MAETNILTAIFAVFVQVSQWIVQTLPTFFTLFYVDGALTLLGCLSIAGIGIATCFLLLGIIQRFMHFAG